MTATNHVLCGALVGLTIQQPILAIIAALVSHFLLDALPHYGGISHVSKLFMGILAADMVMAGTIVLILLVKYPIFGLLAVICAVIAASPDLMWMPMWIRELGHVPPKKLNTIQKFHKNIQWAEKTKYFGVEIVWAAASICLLVKLI